MHPQRASSGQSGLCGGEDIVGGQARPDGIKRLEPVEQIGILRGRDSARQGLVEVVVSVDQPGQEDVTGKVEDFIGCVGKLARRADFFDESIPNKKTTIREFPVGGHPW